MSYRMLSVVYSFIRVYIRVGIRVIRLLVYPFAELPLFLSVASAIVVRMTSIRI